MKHKFLIYADGVNLSGENMNIMLKDTEVLLVLIGSECIGKCGENCIYFYVSSLTCGIWS